MVRDQVQTPEQIAVTAKAEVMGEHSCLCSSKTCARVVGPEVVTPLADAVALVHHNARQHIPRVQLAHCTSDALARIHLQRSEFEFLVRMWLRWHLAHIKCAMPRTHCTPN